MTTQHIASDFSFDAAMLQRVVNVNVAADAPEISAKYAAIIMTCDGHQDSHMQAEQSGYNQWQSARKCSGQWPLWGLSRSVAARRKHTTSKRRSTTPRINRRGVA